MTGQHQRISSFRPRGGRIGPELRDVQQRVLPALELPAGIWDLARIFGPGTPVVVEIGSGMGEAAAHMAAVEPDRGLIAVELHDRGVAALARDVERNGLRNVRIRVADAVDVLADQVPPESLAGIRIWFPDPWPKARHHKRRLVTPGFITLARTRLLPGGRLHLATDVADYAEVMHATLRSDPNLIPVLEAGPRPPWRPWTKYERAGLAAGRHSQDFIFERVPAEH